MSNTVENMLHEYTKEVKHTRNTLILVTITSSIRFRNEGKIAVKKLTTDKDHQKYALGRSQPKGHDVPWLYFYAAATGVVFGPVGPLKVL